MLDKIKADMKDAMKAGDKAKVTSLRLVLAEIHKREIEKKGELTENEIIEVLSGAVRSRKEAIEEFKKGDRPDLVDKESAELEVLIAYLPNPLTPDELKKAINEVIAELGADSAKDFGRVMKEMMNRYKGRVDGKELNQKIREKLS